jgi:predicted nucleic acid-binding protein
MLYISSITVMELGQGVALKERRDPAQGAVLRAWLDEQVLPTFKYSVLAFDAAAARICGCLQEPDADPIAIACWRRRLWPTVRPW